MLLYVTLVSLKRATYSKKKRGEGDEFASEQRAGEGRARRWRERLGGQANGRTPQNVHSLSYAMSSIAQISRDNLSDQIVKGEPRASV